MIVLDTEFSSLDFANASLLSIAALELEKPSNQFYVECRAFDGADIHPKSLEIAGYTIERIWDTKLPTPAEAVKKLAFWAEGIENKIIAGQNVSTDILMIQNEIDRSKINWRIHYRCLDVHSLCVIRMKQLKKKIPLKDGWSQMNLTNVLEFVGIKDERGSHNALEDTKLTAECISRLLNGKQLLKEFKQFPLPKYL